ncbi:MAG: PilZ domain-containing protein [Holophaga sp.]|nr:PilZ domain-containing protein [Holophaga sp.]
MEPVHEMRRFERLSVGPEYEVSLEFQGREMVGAVLQNISACGCGVKLPRSESAGLENGVRFNQLYLIHPSLPYVPLEAIIVRLLGRADGRQEGYVLLGLDFAYVTPTIEQLILRHVDQELNHGKG